MSWQRNGRVFSASRKFFLKHCSSWEKNSFCFPVLVCVFCLSTGSCHTSSGSLKSFLLNFPLLHPCKIIRYLSHNSWNFLLIFAIGRLYCVWLGFVADIGFNLCPRLYSCNEHNLEKSNLWTSPLLCFSFLHVRKYIVHVLPQKENNKRNKAKAIFLNKKTNLLQPMYCSSELGEQSRLLRSHQDCTFFEGCERAGP